MSARQEELARLKVQQKTMDAAMNEGFPAGSLPDAAPG